MTDIVERLRSCSSPWNADMYADEMIEAADEIARLREALAKIEEETERTCQQCCTIENIARAALERKP
jgi:histidinol-phosphate/aromatic aminotransferase/cobyric acid decarboxylase-like protein